MSNDDRAAGFICHVIEVGRDILESTGADLNRGHPIRTDEEVRSDAEVRAMRRRVLDVLATWSAPDGTLTVDADERDEFDGELLDAAESAAALQHGLRCLTEPCADCRAALLDGHEEKCKR